MANEFDRRDGAVSDHLHPNVYKVIIVLGLWPVLSIWGFIGGGHTGLALGVASAFILIALALPLILWRVTRKARASLGSDVERDNFIQWMAGEFEAHHGCVKGREAMIEVLLPIAAVSLGMTVFAIVLHLAVTTPA